MTDQNPEPGDKKNVRHILSVSGGKDSAALAVYMRDRVPEMEYVFCDTHEELQETYDYLDKLQAYLGKPIVHLNPERPFSHHLAIKGGYLPSTRMRWCTEQLKIKPFEAYVGDDRVLSYIGIRADEHRDGYISHKPNITPAYPFKEDGKVLADVYQILEEAGLGLPAYYTWRSRSGCYFCFFQRQIEWVGLLEHHPDLFAKAASFEHCRSEGGRKYTWNDTESLEALAQPERIAAIKEAHEKAVVRLSQQPRSAVPLDDLFSEVINSDGMEEACLICHL